MPINLIPPKFQETYNLKEKAKTSFVYIEINKRMYDLPQARILANKLLENHLAKFGYCKFPHTPRLWKHVSWPIPFTLVIDDFETKYEGEEHFQHLLTSLRKDYTVEVEDAGGLYRRTKLKSNYEKGCIDIRMQGYVKNNSLIMPITFPSKDATPHMTLPPSSLGKLHKISPQFQWTPWLNRKETHLTSHGEYFYYGWVADITNLMALSKISGQQASPIKKTMQQVNQFLDYTYGIQPRCKNATLRLCHGIKIYSDALYLMALKAWSQDGEHFFRGTIPKDGDLIHLKRYHDICSGDPKNRPLMPLKITPWLQGAEPCIFDIVGKLFWRAIISKIQTRNILSSAPEWCH